jgi:hypothetical protein
MTGAGAAAACGTGGTGAAARGPGHSTKASVAADSTANSTIAGRLMCQGDCAFTERTASPAVASPPGRPRRSSRFCSMVLMTLMRTSRIA